MKNKGIPNNTDVIGSAATEYGDQDFFVNMNYKKMDREGIIYYPILLFLI